MVLCDIFGLDARLVKDIQINLRSNQPAEVQVTMWVRDEEFEAVSKVMQSYELVSRQP